MQKVCRQLVETYQRAVEDSDGEQRGPTDEAKHSEEPSRQ